ncbi:bifunctional 2-polyprenyl-6-hydroxyphenol methylase/3-demethylubiquinol 3-O-methyltransferase UbiG [Sandarakinorhabdus rubra]|uniref:bifunctional 2-polyprenyl-6-hydroxyphenol methylase/3-demethylubiquinol 3-O-methyltransferase UbiG n=1 Tax=Sandarakinorhabdus rubra TaxID=2672568 RepID=UPI0013D9162E|nr:bifunctional 2-polyprenyl-6-hydroxyphenol methylase/3-demethylubiquinol 3-O-methyltransferase UbiG [Sandarakinorhabdus rubra]
MSTADSINPDEAAFFGRLAADWWNPKGTSAMLHRITPVRVAHIRAEALAHFGLDAKSRRPLSGLSALDVGCGAGLMAEPLARMGSATTAIDAAPENIEAARSHAEGQGLGIDYRCIAVEDLAATGAQFDLITCLEVVEHVAGRDAFFAAIARLLKPGGLAVFSTPNRTPASWAVVIAGAEHVTRSIPKGAHDWNRFFTPAELAEALRNAGLNPTEPAGLSWRPGRGFFIGGDVSVNYFLSATRA